MALDNRKTALLGPPPILGGGTINIDFISDLASLKRQKSYRQIDSNTPIPLLSRQLPMHLSKNRQTLLFERASEVYSLNQSIQVFALTAIHSLRLILITIRRNHITLHFQAHALLNVQLCLGLEICLWPAELLADQITTTQLQAT